MRYRATAFAPKKVSSLACCLKAVVFNLPMVEPSSSFLTELVRIIICNNEVNGVHKEIGLKENSSSKSMKTRVAAGAAHTAQVQFLSPLMKS